MDLLDLRTTVILSEANSYIIYKREEFDLLSFTLIKGVAISLNKMKVIYNH